MRHAGDACIVDVAEFLEKICGCALQEYQLRCLAMFAHQISSPPCVSWLNTLLERHGFADVFTSCFADAQARFTCHDQYKNRRYENKGSRIDYVIVDSEWLPKVR